MNRNSGVNIVFFVFIAILFLTISCTQRPKQTTAGQLIKADREFSELSAKKGMHAAFLAFIADSGVILRDNAWPLKGKVALAALYSKNSDTSFVLTWEPAYEKIAESGETGYTWGYYKTKVKATGEEGSGTYITVWAKQSDGSWKFVLDTGTDGLPAASK
jgi:ketosteroid isomerase-like protein